MAKAEIDLNIEDDGKVTWKTGKIPQEHHDDADELFDELKKLLGGDVEREQTAARPRQVHHHDHIHQHTHE